MFVGVRDGSTSSLSPFVSIEAQVGPIPDSLLFALLEDAANVYHLRVKHSALFYDVDGQSTKAGGRIVQYAHRERDNQRFRFIRLPPPPDPFAADEATWSTNPTCTVIKVPIMSFSAADQATKRRKRLVVVSDTHHKFGQLQLPLGDILVHCGDFSHRSDWTDFSRPQKGAPKLPPSVVEFNAQLAAAPHPFKVLISVCVNMCMCMCMCVCICVRVCVTTMNVSVS